MNTDNILGNRMDAIDHEEFLKQQQREQQRFEDETMLRLGSCRSEYLLAQALLVMAQKRDQERVHDFAI